MSVCIAEDDFIRDGYLTEPRWRARLDDGSIVIQDDNRPGESEPSAWLRLKAHCREHGRRIVGMSLRFRSNEVPAAADNAAGYFFRKCVIGWLNGSTEHHYLVGYQAEPDGPVQVVRFSVPDLTPRDVESRDPASVEGVGESLIALSNYQSV